MLSTSEVGVSSSIAGRPPLGILCPFFHLVEPERPDADGLRSPHPLGWCTIGLSDGLPIFSEARKGLPMIVYRWISGGRADSLKRSHYK